MGVGGEGREGGKRGTWVRQQSCDRSAALSNKNDILDAKRHNLLWPAFLSSNLKHLHKCI